jgi:hypothetical protein
MNYIVSITKKIAGEDADSIPAKRFVVINDRTDSGEHAT